MLKDRVSGIYRKALIDVTLLFVGPWSLPLFPAPLDL